MNAANLSRPHEYDHKHANVQAGWLRPAVFGAMDGLVSNTGLIAGVAAAGAAPGIVALTGISGLIAGAISMALGEYTSVRTQNEQQESEIKTEAEALRRNPTGEQLELAEEFVELGMTPQTAARASAEVHANHERALRIHLSTELGFSIDDRPSAWTAAYSSLFSFAAGALIPILPFFFGLATVLWAIVFGGVGLVIAGALAAKFSGTLVWRGAVRQLILGTIAVVVTYAIGTLVGVDAI